MGECLQPAAQTTSRRSSVRAEASGKRSLFCALQMADREILGECQASVRTIERRFMALSGWSLDSRRLVRPTSACVPHSANISCSVSSTSVVVDADRRPSRLTRRSVSTVRS